MQHPLTWSSSFILTACKSVLHTATNLSLLIYKADCIISLQCFLWVKSKLLGVACMAFYGLGPAYLSNFKFCYSFSPICSPDHTLVSLRLNSYPFTPLYMLLILPLSFSTMGNIHLSRLSISMIVTSWGELCFVKGSCALTYASVCHSAYLAFFYFWLCVLLPLDWKLFISVYPKYPCIPSTVGTQ